MPSSCPIPPSFLAVLPSAFDFPNLNCRFAFFVQMSVPILSSTPYTISTVFLFQSAVLSLLLPFPTAFHSSSLVFWSFPSCLQFVSITNLLLFLTQYNLLLFFPLLFLNESCQTNYDSMLYLDCSISLSSLLVQVRSLSKLFQHFHCFHSYLLLL